MYCLRGDGDEVEEDEDDDDDCVNDGEWRGESHEDEHDDPEV